MGILPGYLGALACMLRGDPVWQESSFAGSTALVAVTVYYAGIAVCGLRLALHRRRPKWGTPRWDTRTAQSFRELHEGATREPVARSSYDTHSFMISVTCNPAFAFSNWAGCLWRFGSPGEMSGCKPLGSTPFKVCFSVTFYGDRLVKGSGDGALPVRYSDVYDVVEDGRFPDLALIRMKEGEGEVLVKKSALEGATWDEVLRLMGQEELTLREALFGKKGEGA